MTTKKGAPGIYVTETDSSQPVKPGLTGIPASVIGTSLKGQAFVPITVGSYDDYKTVFGKSDGNNYGPLAAYSYLQNNSNSLTFMRVLGAGKGTERNSNGTVDAAGFVVGSGNQNNFAYSNGLEGRTHFLGCFMSQSAGSTYFSDAGITGPTPILRGIILTASGVLATLSSSLVQNNTPPTSAVTNLNLAGSTVGTITDDDKFILMLNGKKINNVITASFNINSPDDDYFAIKLNRDPLRIEEEGYCLYSYFDIHPSLAEINGTGIVTTPGTRPLAFITTGSAERNTYPVNANSSPNFESFVDRFDSAKTPWVTSQNYAGRIYDLFRLHYKSDGEIQSSDQLKFTIENIKPGNSTNKYGTFDLLVRSINNSDRDKKSIESRFSSLSLNPNDKSFIGKVIGDMKMYFDFDKPTSSQKLVLEGNYESSSNYIRVEIHQDVLDGNVPDSALPVGFRGPQHLCLSGSVPLPVLSSSAGLLNTSILKNTVEPPVPFKLNLVNGDPSNPKAIVDAGFCWGVQFEHPVTSTITNGNIQNMGIHNGYMKYYPDFSSFANFATYDNAGAATTTQFGIIDSDLYNKNRFTLENVMLVTGSTGLADPKLWKQATYSRDGSIVTGKRAWKVEDLTVPDNIAYSKFSFYAFGGFNGSNIFDKNKSQFKNKAIEDEYNDSGNPLPTDCPTLMSYVKSIDIMKNTTEVDMQLLAIPGIRNEYVTTYALNMVRDRFDSLYLMDINYYDDNSLLTEDCREANIKITAQQFNSRAVDNSFGATYFPDITLIDPDINSEVFVPSSAAVLRAYATNDTVGKLWNAPAGYNRANLNQSGAKLLRSFNEGNTDSLYNERINPIILEQGQAAPVVWGQKTLQLANTSLNRINVRRLLLSLRRQVRSVANRFIFEPNRESTLARFSSLVEPILANIQTLNGISQYKVQIDTSTTTQQDIENNIVRGKIFIVPINSVEFISIDFEVTK
jgi:hypothetical protein